MVHLPVFGYYTWGNSDGQLPISENHDAFVGTFYSSLYENALFSNRWSICPCVNLITGIFNIYLSITTTEYIPQSHEVYLIEQENITKYRVFTLIAGLAELTLVGGWILHGGATIYYYVQYKSHQHETV